MGTRNEEIIALYKDGVNPTHLAHGFGMTRQNVHKILLQSGVKTRKWSGNYLKRLDKKLQIAFQHNMRSQIPFTARRNYVDQRRNAKVRGIKWEFDIISWWLIWKDQWKLRGRHGDDLVMARYGDTGPYSPDNIKIITSLENLKERHYVRK